jgi:hypothetical protein
MSTDSQRISLAKILESHSRWLTHAFEETKALKLGFDRGTGREEALRRFLRDHLPKRYGVDSGFVVNSHGMQSNQTDIVIYDALSCPVFSMETDKTRNAFPIEGIYGTIGVKSTLTPKAFKEEIANSIAIREVADSHIAEMKKDAGGLQITPLVKHLQGSQAAKRIRPFRMCFAYRAQKVWGRAKKKWQMSVIEELSRYPYGYSLNSLCVHDEGVIAQVTAPNVQGHDETDDSWDGTTPRWKLVKIASVDPFAFFYLSILGLLGRFRPEACDTMRYLNAIMTGQQK